MSLKEVNNGEEYAAPAEGEVDEKTLELGKAPAATPPTGPTGAAPAPGRLLERLESAVEGLFDGLFRGAFGNRVQPLEIARHLTKHAEDARIISLSRVYVPNRYVIAIHPEDMRVLQTFTHELESEFERFVGEWIASRDYSVSSPVRVDIRARDEVDRGRFRITSTWSDSLTKDEADDTTGISTRPAPGEAAAELVIESGAEGGKRILLFPQRTVLGRAADCDIQLRDTLISRHHAALDVRDGQWLIQDLGSTNGTRVNDATRITERKLLDGDEICLGETVLRFQVKTKE